MTIIPPINPIFYLFPFLALLLLVLTLIALLRSKRARWAHAMRNELVEELSVEGEAKVMQNRTGSPKDPVKAARGRAKQAVERKK